MSVDNVQEFLDELDSQLDDRPQVKEYDNDLYKKWFRSKTQSGFLAIKPWFQGMKFKIDIGKTSPDGKLLGNTSLYVDAIDFAAYLNSIVNGTAPNIYTVNEKQGLPTAESFASYGGANINGKPVSRIFKAHYWQAGEQYDPSRFVWKCGHFAARQSDSGAFIPDMKSALSVDSIMVTRQDINSISYILNLSLNSYVANNPAWYEV